MGDFEGSLSLTPEGKRVSLKPPAQSLAMDKAAPLPQASSATDSRGDKTAAALHSLWRIYLYRSVKIKRPIRVERHEKLVHMPPSTGEFTPSEVDVVLFRPVISSPVSIFQPFVERVNVRF